jgi:hypothetical protein
MFSAHERFPTRKVFMRKRSAALLAAICLGPCGVSAACLPYDGVKELSGTLVAKAFPGPPNYASVEAGDEPERYWLLVLDTPVCVADGAADGLHSGAADLKEIQLVLSGDDYSHHRRLLRKHVKVSGSFMSAITAHHKTSLLLENVKIAEAT